MSHKCTKRLARTWKVGSIRRNDDCKPNVNIGGKIKFKEDGENQVVVEKISSNYVKNSSPTCPTEWVGRVFTVTSEASEFLCSAVGTVGSESGTEWDVVLVVAKDEDGKRKIEVIVSKDTPPGQWAGNDD